MLFTNANWLRLSLVAIGLILIAVVVTVSLRDDAAKEDSALTGSVSAGSVGPSAGSSVAGSSVTGSSATGSSAPGSSGATSAAYGAVSTQSPSGTASVNGAGPADSAGKADVPIQAQPMASPDHPVSVFYVDPVQYMTNHVQFVRDRSGNPRMNAILLPPDLEPAGGRSDAKSGGFIGAESCVECHRDYYEGFVQTSHHRTTAKADEKSIRGSFEKGKNTLQTKSPNLRFEMEVVDGAALQRMYVNSGGEEFGADFQFDLVTGSGKLGQTYLYWKDERIYQLHVSYLADRDSWVNSPGFFDGTANFARPVMAPCLECHATYFETVGGNTNHFRMDNFVLGVSCERCHGPAREHVEHHRANPQAKDAHAIVNPSELTRDRSLDMCQVCHGGMPNGLKQPAFTFRVGNVLSDHYEFPAPATTGPATIHSNAQLPRLRRSACFQKSEAMTCTDCHDPHQFERGNMRLFSDRCVKCHQVDACGKFQQLGQSIAENCIDCHMPPNFADDIKIASEGEVFKPTMRDHHIRVSTEATERFLEKLKKE